MRFTAAAELYPDAPPSIAQLLLDAERAGASEELVYVVTAMGPAPGTRGVTITHDGGDLGVTVVVPCPLAARGTHQWGNYGPGNVFADLFGG